MDKPELVYTGGRGKAECIRLILTAKGIEFEECILKTREEFLNWTKSGKLVFGQIPYLKWGDTELVQSGAIVRHVARRTGAMGTSENETARIDMLYEGSRDFISKFVPIGFTNDGPSVAEDVKKTCLPRYLPAFDKVLGANASGYLVGEKLSLADTGLLEVLLFVEEYVGDEAFEKYDNIQKFLEKMKGLPELQTYFTEIRRPQNSPQYVDYVCTLLGWK